MHKTISYWLFDTKWRLQGQSAESPFQEDSSKKPFFFTMLPVEQCFHDPKVYSKPLEISIFEKSFKIRYTLLLLPPED